MFKTRQRGVSYTSRESAPRHSLHRNDLYIHSQVTLEALSFPRSFILEQEHSTRQELHGLETLIENGTIENAPQTLEQDLAAVLRFKATGRKFSVSFLITGLALTILFLLEFENLLEWSLCYR